MGFRKVWTFVSLLCLVMIMQSFSADANKNARPAAAEPIFSELSSFRSTISDKLNDPAISRQNMTILTASIADAFQSGADRLVAVQNTDGGWDWPLDDGNPATGSALNTIGPIAKGLAQAYRQTNDVDHRNALQSAGGFLLSKTNNFSPSDGYLALALDQVFGGTTYRDHVNTNFYGPLGSGTYNRNGAGTLYSTQTYVQLIRDNRASQGIPNLAAWDVGLGLVGAASCGVSGTDLGYWKQGVKDEIDELNGSDYYDVIGLAGALYGLAFVNEEFDPTAGEHAAAADLADLAEILVSYQIEGGGFAWNSGYVIPNDGNETIQETAYAILALAELDRSGYFNETAGAGYYIRSMQLAGGGWENYSGNGENNEITAEALWGMSESFPVHNVTKDTYHPTIQKGIDAASSGDVIEAAAGLFDERVTINKSLVLKGATAGISKKGFTVPSGYNYDTSTQSVIRPSTAQEKAVVEIKADNVTFDGFVVANEVCQSGGVYQDLVEIAYGFEASGGIQVLNNVLGPNTNTASQDGTKGRSGLCIVGPRVHALKLIAQHNKIFDNKGNGCGVMIVGPYGPTYHGAGYYNLFAGSIIEDNEIIGNHRSGIELAGGVQGGVNSADYFVIRNNIISYNGWFSTADKDNLKFGNGIMFIRGGGDRDKADANGSRFVKIEGNEIKNNEKNGYYIGPINQDIFSENNFIQNNGSGTGGYSRWDGVRVDLDELYYSSGTYTDYGRFANVVFSNNNIGGNGSMDARVMQTPTLGPLNASGNWWGDLDPSDNVTGNVDYTPWLKDGTDKSTDPGFQGDFSYLYVSSTSPQTGTKGRIQEGVDMVSGSTVEVLAGTYYESDILLDKDNLTLLGAGENVTIIQPDPLKPDDHTCHPLNGTAHHGVIIKAQNVTLKDFTVNGDVDRNYRMGVTSAYWDGGPYNNTTVQNITVKNIGYRGIVLRMNGSLTTDHKILNCTVSDGGCDEQGFAILGFNTHNIEIKSCKVSHFEQGIATGNYTGTPSVCDIQGNEVTDVVSQAYTLTLAGTGSVFNNNVATFTNPNNEAIGLVTYQCEITLTNNTFTGAQIGISVGYQTLDKSKLVIGTGNKVIGPGTSVNGSIGIDVSDYSWEGAARNFTMTNTQVTAFQTGVFIDPRNGMTCDAVINDCSIAGNAFGMKNNYPSVINALNNWWGDASGPYDTKTLPNSPNYNNVGGLGDEVSPYVDYNPWRTSDIGPIAVALISFGAEPTSGGVLLEWRVASEVGVAGYIIKRRIKEDSQESVVNKELISAKASASEEAYYQFKDLPPQEGDFLYTLCEVSNDGNQSIVASTVASYSPQNAASVTTPDCFKLFDAYPNPFNPQTTIEYQLPEVSHVELVVFSSDGRLVKSLVNEQKTAGRYKVIWNGRDQYDIPVASGLYYYRIKAGDYHKLLKMVFLK